MPHPPSPDARDLLPPLIACLPTAFMSDRPPPALMPVLAPLLRQRVSFLGQSNASWLPLLSWDEDRGSKLPEVVERMELEANPMTGEIELGDIRPVKYRRLDEETLHSRLDMEQYDLSPTFVWCANDEHGQTGAGWRLTDLRSLEDVDDGTQWYDSISEADEAAPATTVPAPQTNGHAALSIPANDTDDDDGSYWAAYDRSSDRTPAQPAPIPSSTYRKPQSDHEYFAKYNTVQPAMDNHNPDEEAGLPPPDMTTSSFLHADTHAAPPPLSSPPPQAYQNQPRSYVPLGLEPSTTTSKPHDSVLAFHSHHNSDVRDLSMPRPISPTSSHSSIERLEEQAEAMSAAEAEASLAAARRRGGEGIGPEGAAGVDDRAQLGIKQHISTDIKSLFRLAKTAGMDRRDFEEHVRRELEVLCLLEGDE